MATLTDLAVRIAQDINATNAQVAAIVTPGKNLLNPAGATHGIRLNTVTGTVITDANVTLTDHLPVTPGQGYALNHAGGYTFWSSSGAIISGAAVPGNAATTFTAPAGAATIRVHVHDLYWGISAQLERGSVHTPYEPYQITLAPGLADQAVDEALADLAVTPDQTTFVQNSKNLYNDATRIDGYYLQHTNGTIGPIANYFTSDFIPVKAGQPYVVNVARKLVLYDTSEGYVSGLDPTQGAPVTFTPTVDGYVRFSVALAGVGGAGPYQLEKGSSPTPFVEYGIIIPNLLTSTTAPPLTLTRVGDSFHLATALDGDPLLINADLRGSLNGAFNFARVYLNGAQVVAPSDDITPLRTQLGTVGANHGYPCVRAFTNPDAKTTADLGSVWTDGVREYVLMGFDTSGRLVVGGDHSTDGAGAVTSPVVAPAGDLTHVSGATHTGTISAASLASAQLYPSVARVNVTLWADGRRVTGDETATPAGAVQVRESYEIINYAAAYDTMKANIGTPLAALVDTLDGDVLVENRYTFKAGGVCTVETDLTELAPTALAACGFLQAAPLALTGAAIIRNVPGVGTVGGHDWAGGVDLASHSSNVIVKASDLLHPARPPALALDRARIGGQTVIGFALGYMPHAGAVTDSPARLTAASSILWDLRGTDKSYPTALASKSVGWGRLSARGYRVYLAPGDADSLASNRDAAGAWATLNARAQL